MSLSTEKLINQGNGSTSAFQEDLECLRRVFMFNGLDYECLKLLAMLCHRVVFTAGDQLMIRGEDDGYAFIILSGKATAYIPEDDGDRPIRQYDPGKLVGCCGLLGNMPRLFTVVADEKTRTLRLGRQQFQKTLSQFPGDLSKVTGNLVAELTSWEQMQLACATNGEDDACCAYGVSLI